MKKILTSRVIVLCVVCGIVILSFCLRLVSLQIINGAAYLEKASNTTSVYRVIHAARGEIVDRYGRILATNRVGFNVQLNAILLPKEDINDTIIELSDILSESGEMWIDPTPLSEEAPYEFKLNSNGEETNAVISMKEHFVKNTYATSDQVWDAMIKKYELESIPVEYQRIVAGVRYQMELKEYSANNSYTFATDISIKSVTVIKEKSLILPGVDIVEESIRIYPDGTLMPHIIGTVGPIYAEQWASYKDKGYDMNAIVGKTGIEYTYEENLKGTDGLMRIDRNKEGAIIHTEVVEEPIPGNTVVLTIDKEMQEQAQAALVEQVAAVKDSEGASVVTLDTNDGGILAIATYPTFDLNNYTANYDEYISDPLNPLFNRATMGTYRPGSAFKPIVGLAGLYEGVIEPETLIVCQNPYFRFDDISLNCLQHGHSGAIDLIDAIAYSCNIFFYETGVLVGNENYNKMANNMGLATKTGFELGEATGNLTSKSYTESFGSIWTEGNVAQAAIGQMDTMVTPIQLATYAGTLANDGIRYQTHIVKSILNYNMTEVYYETPKNILSQVTDDEAFEVVTQGMIGTSWYGSAKTFLSDYEYTIASKTGTPQVTTDKYNGTIVAFGPAEQPEIAVSVVLENCGDGYQLARTVRRMFESYYAGMGEELYVEKENTLLK